MVIKIELRRGSAWNFFNIYDMTEQVVLIYGVINIRGDSLNIFCVSIVTHRIISVLFLKVKERKEYVGYKTDTCMFKNINPQRTDIYNFQ